jgi:hypothetical protein
MSADHQPTEAQVRAMRDLVYEKPSTDANWERCKDFYMRPENIRWLQDATAGRQATKANP